MTSIRSRRLIVGSVTVAVAALVPILDAPAQERSRSFSFSSSGGLERFDRSAFDARIDAVRERAVRPATRSTSRTAVSPDGRARATGTGDRVSVTARSGPNGARSTSRASSGTGSGAVQRPSQRPSVERSVSRSRSVTRSP